VTLKPGLGINKGHRKRHLSIRHSGLPTNFLPARSKHATRAFRARVHYRSSIWSTWRNRKLISTQHFVISGGFEWDERVQPFRLRHYGKFSDAKYICTKMYNFKVVYIATCLR